MYDEQNINTTQYTRREKKHIGYKLTLIEDLVSTIKYLCNVLEKCPWCECSGTHTHSCPITTLINKALLHDETVIDQDSKLYDLEQYNKEVTHELIMKRALINDLVNALRVVESRDRVCGVCRSNVHNTTCVVGNALKKAQENL